MNVKDLLDFGDNRTKLPWPDLKIPEFREGRVGKWRLKTAMHPIVRGYFRGLQPMIQKNYALVNENTGKIWMSVTPMELESQAPHAAEAKGHTVIVGLGMGALLYNVIARTEVTQVTVIEKDHEIALALCQFSDPESWVGWEKVRIDFTDALYGRFSHLGHIDFMAIDIWPRLGAREALGDVYTIQEKVQAKKLAWWGMELDFISWLAEAGCSPPATDEQYADWREAIGLSVITIPAKLAEAAARNAAIMIEDQVARANAARAAACGS